MTFNKLANRKETTALSPWYRLIDDIFDMRPELDVPGFGTGWVPSVDVEETDEAYQIRAEMPGLKKEDVKISLVENVLMISGEKKHEERSDKKRYHRLERTYGSFQRSFSLPAPINSAKIAAEFKNGVLEVTVPKSEEAKPKEIEIKVS